MYNPKPKIKNIKRYGLKKETNIINKPNWMNFSWYNLKIPILIIAYNIIDIFPDKIPDQQAPPKANKIRIELKNFFLNLNIFIEYIQIVTNEISSNINQII